MKQLTTIFLLFFALSVFGQVNNIVANSGIAYTAGPPTFVPGARGSCVGIDTLTGLWWVNPNRLSGTTWFQMGHTMRKITGTGAPSGAPTKFQSWLVSNSDDPPDVYLWDGAEWDVLNAGGGGGAGTVTTDATLSGDGSGGDPLKIAQQSATTSEVLTWTGTTWEPTHGSPHIYVTTTGSITADYNWVLVGTLSAGITIGLPSCNAANHEKVIDVLNNSAAQFGVTLDPASTETFQDGQATKTIYQYTAATCVCRFNSGTGKWFFTLL
jgi:hypothetical protein